MLSPFRIRISFLQIWFTLPSVPQNVTIKDNQLEGRRNFDPVAGCMN